MSYATATFPDVTALDAQIFYREKYRRKRRSDFSFGAVATACITAFMTVAAVWVIVAVRSGGPNTQAKPSVAPMAAALLSPRPVMVGAGGFSAAESVFARPVYAGRFENDASAMQIAALTPQTEAAPLAPMPASEDVSSVPLPRSRPLAAPPIQVAHETASVAAAPRLAALTPPRAPMVEQHAALPPVRNKVLVPTTDSRTAVYDISAHTVFMPNGQKLEAHSGLGDKLDNPRFVSLKNRGPTPPNIYDLALREQLFHGVRAIRLKPVDDNKMYGRDGMLAHTYMLGHNGQSFGCVSFKDYQAFLQAYLRGEVDRLVVVAHRDATATPVALLRRGHDDQYAFNSR